MQIGTGQPETGLRLEGAGRAIWLTLIVVSGVVLSALFACVTPFAALATLAALKTNQRDTALVVGLVWLGNQAVGFGFLHYPLTWSCVGWGVTIGASAGLAVLAAMALAPRRPAALAISLPFVGAFAAYELGLYVAGFVLPGSDGAFSLAIVRQIFMVNAVALMGLIALHQVAVLLMGDRGARLKDAALSV